MEGGVVQGRGVVRSVSVAPMMDRTDRYYRAMMRMITRHTLLYTEMITTGAILNGDRAYLLDFDAQERPLALQLGGDDPQELASCARIAEQWGYDEVNLNVGCPSERVQRGSFGACLMAQPEVVAEGVAAMRGACALPVTVKHRIGVDDLDRYEDMARFVSIVAEAGADRFSVHARKALLSGLSPKENRTIPPLRYEDVYRLQQDFPELVVEINGGVVSLDEVEAHLGRVQAVMIGRAAYDDPYMFAEVDARFFGDEAAPLSRDAIAERLIEAAERHMSQGGRLTQITRHALNLFAHQTGARGWKRAFAQLAHKPGAGPEVIEAALAEVRRQREREVAFRARSGAGDDPGAGRA